jgi:hypothetical protein
VRDREGEERKGDEKEKRKNNKDIPRVAILRQGDLLLPLLHGFLLQREEAEVLARTSSLVQRVLARIHAHDSFLPFLLSLSFLSPFCVQE